MNAPHRKVARLHGRNTHLREIEARLIAERSHLPLSEQKKLVIPQLWDDAKLAAVRESRAYKLLNTPFRRFGYTNVAAVGAMMDHRTAHSDLTRSEWEEAYFTEVLSYQSFVQLAIKAHRQVVREYLPTLKPSDAAVLRQSLTTEFTLNALYIRLIVQTDQGFQTEVRADAVLKENGITVRTPTSHEENYFHLDRVTVADDENSVVADAYQIKQRRFAIPARGNEGFRLDQLNNLRSQLQWESQTGGQVFYLFEEDLAAGHFNPVGIAEVAKMCDLLHEVFPTVVTA